MIYMYPSLFYLLIRRMYRLYLSLYRGYFIQCNIQKNQLRHIICYGIRGHLNPNNYVSLWTKLRFCFSLPSFLPWRKTILVQMRWRPRPYTLLTLSQNKDPNSRWIKSYLLILDKVVLSSCQGLQGSRSHWWDPCTSWNWSRLSPMDGNRCIGSLVDLQHIMWWINGLHIGEWHHCPGRLE